MSPSFRKITHRIAVSAVVVALVFAPGTVRAQEGERSYTISPNERIHVVQQKVDMLDDRLELTLYPVSAQLNSRWTEHLGSGVAGAWHFSDTFALQGLFTWNAFLARETSLQSELREKARLQPPSAPSVLTQWYGALSMEMSPIYGKIAYYKEAMLHFSLVLSAGVGVAGTRVQILDAPPPDDPNAPGPAYASAGMQPAGLVGAGFRVHVADDWLLRVEIRDLVYSARIDELNGCTRDDLQQVISGNTSGVGASCSPTAFNDTLEARRAYDRADGSAATVNQVSAYVGFSYLF